MLLLTIEIDLDSFFDVNLVVFTTIAFLFSIVIITSLVFGLRPINSRARMAKGIEPEKLNLVYLRLIIYILAEFIAFVSDIFLVIFGNNYKLPWATTSVFLTITFYKLVFVLFRDFRDLGFNAKGITETFKTASKVVSNRSLEPINEALDKQSINNEENEDNKKESMNKKVKYKKKTLRSKLPTIFIFLIVILCVGLQLNASGNSHLMKTTTENIYRQEDLNNKIARAKRPHNDNLVASEFTESKSDSEVIVPQQKSDTVIIKMRGEDWARIIITEDINK